MFHAVAIGKYDRPTAHTQHDTLEDAAAALQTVLEANTDFSTYYVGIVSDTGTVWTLNEALGHGVSIVSAKLQENLRVGAGVVLL